mgnify:FL=1
MVEWLSQVTALKREIDDLSQRIAALEWEARGCRGRISGLSHPRAETESTIAAKAEALRAKMDARRLERMEELGRLYAFIDDIPNARLRLIFSLRYLDGLTWQQIAFKIGEYDEQIPRRLHNQALKRMLGCDRAG